MKSRKIGQVMDTNNTYKVYQGLISHWPIAEFKTYEEAALYIATHKNLGYYLEKGNEE